MARYDAHTSEWQLVDSMIEAKGHRYDFQTNHEIINWIDKVGGYTGPRTSSALERVQEGLILLDRWLEDDR